ncbi:Pentatricopeptide repeat-containing protein [Glycine max]|nr:Pentatricopeptide repeat-containing protein [Glycine max]
MIDGYVQNGVPEDALVLPREMQMKDGIRPNKVSLISVLRACALLAGLIGGKQIHGSMISAYGLHGRGEEAIITYYKMLQQGFKPDMITVVGVLSACSKSGLVDEGISIYKSLMTKYEIKPTIEICACVVDMFDRSGQLDQASEFIKDMP